MFVTDQLAAYTKALLTHFGCWVERISERSGRVLRRWMPDERLRYAQVKKRRARRKIVAVSTEVVFGTTEAVQSALKALGQRINTAFIERVNRTIRTHVPGLGRREEGLTKTHLQHLATAAAMNLTRVMVWFMEKKPKAQTRRSPSAALAPAT
jgi:hypothetical protein